MWLKEAGKGWSCDAKMWWALRNLRQGEKQGLAYSKAVTGAGTLRPSHQLQSQFDNNQHPALHAS